ncbi:alpha/beta fold hydrolase ['Camptotheca acuminata' phytoplasma]|uniref:alpha/beta fold hydrolase n=1 Tax='Camptotheca acuminata' phytoplasma TaxID=3239192 RepID=UPI00351A3B2E
MLKSKKNLYLFRIFLFICLSSFIYKQKIYAYPLLDKNETSIHTDFKEVENARLNVIITHGIAESSKEYEKLAHRLNQFNYNVLLYDIRSHGQSRNDNDGVADIDSFHTFIDDLHLIIDSLKQKNGLRNILLGHSLGGMINNCYVFKYNDIDGVINSGAPTKIIDSVIDFLDETKVMNMNNIPVGRNYERLSRLPLTTTMKNFRSVNFLTPNFVRTTMVRSIEYFQENMINKSYRYPTSILLLHGGQDTVILPENSKEFFDLMKNKNKKFKLYPTNYHNLFNDLNNEQVYADVIEWLQRF